VDTRRFRRLLAPLLLVATVGSGLVLAAAAPVAAAALPTATGVETRVSPATPMWVVDFIFTFDAAIDCSGGPQSLDLHFRISNDVGGVPQGGTTGMAPACVRDAGLAANQAVVHFDLLSRGADSFNPSQYVTSSAGTVSLQLSSVWAKAKLHPAGQAQDTLEVGRPIGTQALALPTAPVWIGMGDGYTSQLVQTPDGCITAACYQPEDASASWVGLAAEEVNQARIQANNANSGWRLQPVVVARNGATSADVAAGPQNTAMRTELAKHVISRPGNAFGDLPSWNWVSVSAGLVDVGIPAAMQAYSGGPTGAPTGGRFPYDVLTNPAPWAVTSAAQCPDLGNVAGTTGPLSSINGAAGAAIAPNLSAMVQSATGIDRSVHVVQVLYPWLTEPGNPCASDHGGLASNRTVMQRLHQVADITANPTDNVVALDLQDGARGFGDIPTGTPPLRLNSRLWLSRPFGYPYPSRTGISDMKNAAIAIFGAAAADVLPPEVYGAPVPAPVLSAVGLWWNLPSVAIQWTANDPSGLDAPSTAVWKPIGPISQATTEGSQYYESPAQACDVNGRCATGRVPLSIDRTAPTNTVVASRPPDHAGWYNGTGGPVNLTWTASDVKFDGAGNPVLDANGNPIATSGVRPDALPAPVTVSASSSAAQSFGGLPGQVCDYAANCAPLQGISVRVDLVAPSLASTITSADSSPLNGWYQKPVTVGWTKSDAHSGVDSSATELQSGTLALGTRTFTGTVCDVAGNCTAQAYVAQVDDQVPTVSIIGGAVEGDTYPSNGVPTLSCAADDQPDLSGVEPSACQLTVSKGAPDSTGKSVWTYTANATDRAGNAAVPFRLSINVQGAAGGDGRMTGKGKVESGTYGDVRFDLSIRCSGSASSMNLAWGSSSFELDSVSAVSCRDDGTVAGPGPFDTLTLTGTGQYCKGGSFEDSDYHDDDDHDGGWWNDRHHSGYHRSGFSAADYDGATDHHGGCSGYDGQSVTCVTSTITMTLVDGGSGRNDSVKIVIVDNKGKTVLSVTAKLSEGNLVAGAADGGNALDTIAPTVTPKLTSSVAPGDGWYRSKVTVSWTIADTGGSGLVSSTPPASVIVTADGQTIVKSAPVCDVAGNCTVGQVTVNVDTKPPVVGIAGAESGRTYATKPVISCSASDQAGLSGLAGPCTVNSTQKTVSGGTSYTYTAAASDKAGNTASKTVTFTVTTGMRMTGEGSTSLGSSGSVKADFFIDCVGGSSSLAVTWAGGSFDLGSVSTKGCSDDPSVVGPGPFDTLVLSGSGSLCAGTFAGHASYDRDDDRSDDRSHSSSFSSARSNGRDGSSSDSDGNPCQDRSSGASRTCSTATIQLTYVDAGNNGQTDTLRMVIKDSDNKVVLDLPVKVLSNGNLKARLGSPAQG
jgi:hypothetical protein